VTARVQNLSGSGAVPVGLATFLDRSLILRGVPLTRGRAVLKTLTLPAGRQPISVVYSGGKNIESSVALIIIIETVQPPRFQSKVHAIRAAAPRGALELD
jgi:hypothetical protein